MSHTYIAYLTLAFIGTLLVQRFFLVQINERAALKAIIFAGGAFLIWDILAVQAGHWSFGWIHTLGIAIYNQPIEEVAFFVVIPLFGLTLWELFGEKHAWRRK